MEKYLPIIYVTIFICLFVMSVEKTKKSVAEVVTFGKGNKVELLAVAGLLFYGYHIFAYALGLPILSFWFLHIEVFQGAWLLVLGNILALAAILVFHLAFLEMGKSFRVGVDKNHPDKMVTYGIFARSRNPMYVAFLFLGASVFCFMPVTGFLLAFVVLFLVVAKLVAKEERFMLAYYGEEFVDYCQRVRRYL